MREPPLTVRLNVFFAGTLAALVADGWLLAAVATAILAFLGVRAPGCLRSLARPGFWIFAALAVGFGALLFGPVGAAIPSAAGALVGAILVVRSAAILVLAYWVAARATPFEFAALGERLGVRWLGFAFGVAVNALPDLEASARRTWDAMRARGGLRRNRRQGLRLFAVATLTNALYRADAQADAATARGFRLDVPAEPGPRWTADDFRLAGAAWALTLAVAWLGLRS